MPERDEGEDGEEVEDLAGFRFQDAVAAASWGDCGCCVGVGAGARGKATAAAANRDVEVAYDPAIEGAVPGTPECEGGVVIRHAAGHVLWGVDAVDQSPETEEAPRDKELQPNDVEVEVGHHAELRWGVKGPVRGGFGDGHDVDIV